MTEYTIRVTYTTGNSFNKYTEERNIELTWTDLDKAKAALQIIKEHQKALYELRTAWSASEKKELKEKYSLKPWFNNQGDSYAYEILVQNDSGEYVEMYAFWVGYFESIQSAKIITVIEDDNDMEITF
ncbi:hypothetical protein DQT32_03610 [Salmonella enterica subsp. enterica serovar Braenderup]|nr:hypothetical protein [Salmonella enterica subsp. enterica serovar Braenderup]